MENLYEAEWQGQMASYTLLHHYQYNHNVNNNDFDYDHQPLIGDQGEQHYAPIEKDVPARIMNICQPYTLWCPVSIINMLSTIYEIYDFI